MYSTTPGVRTIPNVPLSSDTLLVRVKNIACSIRFSIQLKMCKYGSIHKTDIGTNKIDSTMLEEPIHNVRNRYLRESPCEQVTTEPLRSQHCHKSH